MDFKLTLLQLLTFYTFIVNGYRLPSSVRPDHYRLEIISYLGIEGNFDFDGKIWIKTSCAQPTKNITLHSKDLKINTKDLTLTDVSSKVHRDIKNLKIEFVKSHDFLIILFEEPLTEDHKYEIYIPFKGTMDDGLAGFYRSSYIDKSSGKKRWLGVTQFEAISARRAFPCFDEPGMKATFDISIGRRDGYRAISNMPLVKTEPIQEKEGWYWDRFDHSVPMSTYLVAYIVSDFDYKPADPIVDNKSNVTFRIWARKDALDQVDFAKDVGPKALHFYEQFFNIDYPLPKQDMVAIPDFSAGAMENWGLITYREVYLLYDPKVSSKTSQHSVASVVAHELAHQWFGNLVTMEWWTDLWLNEGFATYMASVAVDHLFPQWNSLIEEAAGDMISVFSFDSLRTSHPVSVPIGDPKEIDEIFDTISYKKGSSLIRMMGLYLGEETLKKGVSNYLRKHRYDNAEQDDLWESLTQEAHKNNVLPNNLTVKTIMDTWTLQTGYPVITVDRNYADNSLEINQRRFLRDLVQTKDANNPCWWVPLSYSTKENLNFHKTNPQHWLSCPEETQKFENVVTNDSWIIFNNQMAGIYRVNYDEQNWNMIIEALNTKENIKIPILNRVQLIVDAADLAYVGSIKYDIFFNLLNYLKNEADYLPWKAALGKTTVLTNFLKRSPVYGLYKDYMQHLLTPLYERSGGFSTREERSDKLDMIKMQVLTISKACRFEVANCVSEAIELFKKYQNSNQNPIPNDLRGVVYCTALQHGGEAEWDFLWHKYQTSNVATEKSTILNSLGCTREIWLLNRYLEWSMDDNIIRRQDCSSVFSSVAKNVNGYFTARNFFYSNVKKIYKHFESNKRRIARYLSTLASQIIEEKEQEALEHVLKSNQDVFSEVKQSVEQSQETVRINIQWQNKHIKNIYKIFGKYSI